MPQFSFARAVQVHQLVRQATMLVTMAALAQLGLSLVEIGEFESLRFLSYALSAFWLTSVSNAYLRVRQTSAHPERWYVLLVLVFALCGLLAFASFAFALRPIAGLLLDQPELGYGLSFGTYVLGLLMGQAVESEAIADGKAGRLLLYSITSYGLQLVLFLLPMVLGYPLYIAMWGLAASAVYRIAWVVARYLRTSDPNPPITAELSSFWASASGLSVYSLATILVLVVDHALVSYASEPPAEAMAMWRYGAQELPLLVGVVGGLNATALQEMQLGAQSMLSALKRRATRVNRLFLPLVALLMATSSWWWPLLLTEQFYPAHVLFNTTLLLVPSRLVFTTPILISLDLERTMTTTSIIENLLNVAVSLALLPSLGLLGIAVGTVVAFSFERIVYVIKLARLGYPLSAYTNVREWTVGTLILVALYATCTDFTALVY